MLSFNRTLIWFWCFLALSAISVSGGFLRRMEQEPYNECTISDSEDCKLSSFITPTLVYPGGDTKCIFNTEEGKYRFQVMPGSGIDKKKVVLHFQGGGSCISPLTCSSGIQAVFQQQFGETTFTSTANPTFGGIFNESNAENPFLGWTKIVILYCSADVYVGDTVIQESENVSIHMSGAANTQAVLSWVKENIPNPKFLMLSGESSGSLGVQVWAHKILKMFKNNGVKASQMAVVADSYPGFNPPSETNLTSFYNMCGNPYEIPGFEERCNAGGVTLSSISKEVMAQHKDVPFAFVHAKGDATQQFFYCFGLNAYVQDPNVLFANLQTCISQPEYYEGVKNVLLGYSEVNQPNNVITYLLNSADHTFMNEQIFYEAVEGNADTSVSFKNWIKDLTEEKNYEPLKSVCVSAEIPSYDFGCDESLTSKSFTRPHSNCPGDN